jgi:myosin-18
LQTRHGELQQASERLEMELLFCRAADMNGSSHAGASSTTTEDEGDADPDGPVAMAVSSLRQKLERSNRELALAKRRLTQQHEDDLEQMMALKKMMEKKVKKKTKIIRDYFS